MEIVCRLGVTINTAHQVFDKLFQYIKKFTEAGLDVWLAMVNVYIQP